MSTCSKQGQVIKNIVEFQEGSRKNSLKEILYVLYQSRCSLLILFLGKQSIIIFEYRTS